MRTDDFDYSLPTTQIALHPVQQRDQSRLLVVNRASGRIDHCACFRNLTRYLQPGDLLVFNNSRVLPARLRGRKPATGGEVELLLLSEVSRNDWWALLRPGKRVRAGTQLEFANLSGEIRVAAIVIEKNREGHCRVRFSGPPDVRSLLEQLGEMPLPPYISRSIEIEDAARYQTVFAKDAGSVAAPTAGLHFTEELLEEIRSRGVELHFVTLHVGLGTFAPVKEGDVTQHPMHEERFILANSTAEAINQAKIQGRRVIAVGTTTVRVLESVAAANGGKLTAADARTRIFIYPPYQFQVTDGLLTNFHLPRSTLLMLVSAFAAPGETRGREQIMRVYSIAIQEKYRFYSYGDAMLLL